MKHVLIILLSFFSLTANAQIYQNRPEYGWNFNRIKISNTLTIPQDTALRSNNSDAGAIVYNMSDSALYAWNGSWWIKQGRYGSVDPANNYTYAGWGTSFAKDTSNAAEGIIMNLGGDTILNIFRLSLTGGHSGNSGKIVKRYSYDGGLTWSNVSDVFDSIYDDRNIGGGLVGSRVVLFFRRYDAIAVSTIDLGFMYSDDKGATWSSYTTYSPVSPVQVPFGNLVKINGRWVQPLYGANISELASTTDGTTWTHYSTMWDYTISLTRKTSETTVSYIGTDSLIAISRNENGSGGPGQQFKSTDNGVTWTYVGLVPYNGNTPAPGLVYDSAKGTVLYMVGERTIPYQTDSLLLFTAPKSVLSDTSKWRLTSAFQRPVPNNRDFYGYPTAARLNNGDYLVTFCDKWQRKTDTTQDVTKESAALYQTRIQFLSASKTPSINLSGNVAKSNLQSGYFLGDKDNSAFSFDGTSNLITPKAPGTLTLYGRGDTTSVFELRNATNATRVIMYGAQTSDGTIFEAKGWLKATGLYSSNAVVSAQINTPIVMTNQVRTGLSAGKLEISGGSSGPTSYIGAQIDFIGGNAAVDKGVLIFRPGTGFGSTPSEKGRFDTLGNFNAIGNITAGAELRGKALNSNASLDSMTIYGGSTGGFRGAGITLVGGSAVSNPGVIIFRAGTTGGGAIQAEAGRITSGGLWGIGTLSPTAKMDITGVNGYNQFRLRTNYTPTSSADANGSTGSISWDDNFIYVKTSAGWKRSALTTF